MRDAKYGDAVRADRPKPQLRGDQLALVLDRQMPEPFLCPEAENTIRLQYLDQRFAPLVAVMSADNRLNLHAVY